MFKVPNPVHNLEMFYLVWNHLDINLYTFLNAEIWGHIRSEMIYNPGIIEQLGDDYTRD